MTDRNDWGERRQEQFPAEGVRIVRPEEAQAALETGAATGRRSDDELGFGDVPPVPGGPRPAHRFPLTSSVDPAPVPRPRPPVGTSEPSARGAMPPDERGALHVDANSGDQRRNPGDRQSDRMSVPDEPQDDGDGQIDYSSDFAGSTSFGDGPPQTESEWADADWTWSGGEEPGTSQSAATDDATSADDATSPDVAASPSSAANHGESNLTARSRWAPPQARSESSAAPGVADSSRSEPVSGPSEPVPAPPLPRASDAGHQADSPNPSEVAGMHPSPGGSSPLPFPNAPSASWNEGRTVTGGFGTDLPHWTDPPTGETRKLPGNEGGHKSDDLEAWRAASHDTGVRWREDEKDWDDPAQVDERGSEETRVGAMEPARQGSGDPFSFDEDFGRLDEERSGKHRLFTNEFAEDEDQFDADHLTQSREGSSGRKSTRGARSGRAASDNPGTAGGDRNLTSAVAVGVGLIALLVIGYAVGPIALLVLSAAILLACSLEAFAMVQRRGFKPATLLGLAGVVGLSFAAYWRGTEALSVVTAVLFIATMLWYLVGVVDARPVANVSASLMIYLWIGFLGSFAALLLRAPHGRGLFLGAVLPTVAADVVAYLIGSRIGSRTLARGVSPGKTVEGVIAGGIAALVVGAIVGHEVAPWGGFKHGLLLGLVIAVLAPLGDLFESMVKRDLSVKDSGSALPGHGGLLDRFDSMLLVLPATYYLAIMFNLHV